MVRDFCIDKVCKNYQSWIQFTYFIYKIKYNFLIEIILLYFFKVLDLSGNSFETLPSDHFMRLSLINLQKIYLSKCKLSHINTRAFRGLSNLVDLDLSQNALREVPTSTFPDCQGLMRLILSGNPISQLQRNAFMHLESLTTLEMNHCAIENIEKVSNKTKHS